MKKYITADPWRIIESSFDPELHPNTESLMSIGNGRLGQRANFEEIYTGESLQGSYIAGVYYPDKTRVGWWKNGYPEYFAKVLNSIQWHNVILHVDGELIDLANADIQTYHRELDMQTGLLSKEVSIRTTQGKMIRLRSERFYSLDNPDLAVLRYEVKAEDDIDLKISTGLDSDVRNSDSNYDEDFWHDRHGENGYLQASTKKTGFVVGAAYHGSCKVGDQELSATSTTNSSTYATNTWEIPLSKGQTAILDKVSAISSSRYYEPNTLQEKLITTSSDGHSLSYEVLRSNHAKVWKQRWDQNDVIIEGDIEAQQGIRFNIFQLYQTYDGSDSRLNIGPKGFTGEKYGGSTYWDTEAYCLPFYMSTTSPEVARNLLVYRYQHLQKAIENAEKLGFTDGAALYPMVTMNGEECHNEWEITFEEIHRNGAIAYAIFDYLRYTGDQEYLGEYGIEVLVGIARFWAQRVHMSPRRGLYVMLGVTGPNEYENNVDNNWYTNYIARWCLRFTLESLEAVKASDSTRYDELWAKLSLESTELDTWREVIELMYLPEDKHLGIFVQHDGYLDKENVTISDLSADHRPINQKWSWDRILRSPYIKQADVLQGIYFFEDEFDSQTIQRNFDYYEPRTVHESSLSPCVHSILASSLGMRDKAYEMYLRTARLDLDDYNNDTEDGCHITSMAGTWMSIVEGFAGMRIRDDHIAFAPFLPEQWTSYQFKINYRGVLLNVLVDSSEVIISSTGEGQIDVRLYEDRRAFSGGDQISGVLAH